jgi:hypothetical protein
MAGGGSIGKSAGVGTVTICEEAESETSEGTFDDAMDAVIAVEGCDAAVEAETSEGTSDDATDAVIAVEECDAAVEDDVSLFD